MTDYQPTASTHMGRGFSYSLTSALALLSGYLINSTNIISLDIILILSLYLISLFFFIVYVVCFHYQNPAAIIDDILLKKGQKEAIIYTGIFVALVIVILLLVYSHFNNNNFPSFGFILNFAFYSILYLLYAYYLYNNYYTKKNNQIIRHQLVFPIILTIGINLYYAHFFHEFKQFNYNSTYLYIPILNLIIYFLISIFLDKKRFLKISLYSLVIITILITLQQFDFIELPLFISKYYSVMVFSLVSSAYLGVFEAWRITSHFALKEKFKGKFPPQSESGQINIKADSIQYRFATMIALIVSSMLVPLVFIYTKYGGYFLLLSSLHAILAYFIWSYKTFLNINSLIINGWDKIKSIMGFLFLIILSLTSYKSQPENDIFGPIGYAFTVLGPGVYLVARNLLNEYKINNDSFKDKIITITLNIDNQLMIIYTFSFIIFLFLFILGNRTDLLLVKYKANYACSVYVLFMFLSGISIIYNKFINSGPILSGMIGIIQLTRILTSFTIALIIFFPSILIGNEVIYSIKISFPFLFASMGGFALNDYYDVEKDKINKKNRAIPGGKISKTIALLISCILLIIALLVAVFISRDYIELILYLSSILGVIMYNIVVKKAAILKPFYASLLCGLPVIYSIVLFKYNVFNMFILLSTITFISGREILMDIKDVKGDRLCDITTLPMVLGEKYSEKLAFLIQAIGIILLGPLVIYLNKLAFIILYGLIILIFLMAIKVWAKNRRKTIFMLWAPMIYGIAMLIYN